MNSQAQNKKQLALGLFILSVLFFVGYLLISKAWDALFSVDPKLGAALVVVSATAIFSLFSVLISKYLDRRFEILADLREKKIPPYEKIIKFIFRIALAKNLGKKQTSEKEMIKFMAEITPELVIWGSDEMLDAFRKFRMTGIENANEKSNNSYDVLYMVADLLLAIRKDLGHKNKNMSRRKVLEFFINDIPDELK